MWVILVWNRFDMAIKWENIDVMPRLAIVGRARLFRWSNPILEQDDKMPDAQLCNVYMSIAQNTTVGHNRMIPWEINRRPQMNRTLQNVLYCN